jgi:hypothetical protein
MAMACLRLVTFFPLRPDFSLPCFISFISRSTDLPAAGLYLRVLDDFLEDLPFALLFFAEPFFEDDDFEDDLFFFVGMLYVPPRRLGRMWNERGCRAEEGALFGSRRTSNAPAA